MATKRRTSKNSMAATTTRKPRVTAKMRLQRAEQLVRLGRLLPIGNQSVEPVARFAFLGFDSGSQRLLLDDAYESLAEARNGYRHRGNSDFDPSPPPRLVVDLDASELAVIAVSYNLSAGMEFEEEFLLEAQLDYQYTPETGGEWQDAYCWPRPTVNPDLSPLERAAKLEEWLESECRDSWDPGDE